MVNTSEDRGYSIQSYGNEFFTVVCADGRQVVMGLLSPSVVAYFFDAEGCLLGDEHRSWNLPAQRKGNGPYEIYDQEYETALVAQIQEWQHSLAFSSTAIRIRPFLDSRHPVGIEDLPVYLQPDDDEWQTMSAEEQREIEAERADWLAKGQFVWWWAKDYWTDADGQVFST